MISFAPFPGVRGGFGGRKHQPDTDFLPTENILQLRQVHGDRIHIVRKTRDAELAKGAEGDALISVLPHRPLVVRTADCLPILVAHPSGVVSAVHAGWRGTLAKIAFQTLKKMEADFGFPLSEAWVALGPSICRECFEIGEDVAAPFRKLLCGEGILLPRGEKYRLDLRAANVEQITAAGVLLERIQVHEPCTRCREEEYFSHRGALSRGEINEGRNYSWVAWMP
jgi:YfiH family protein